MSMIESSNVSELRKESAPEQAALTARRFRGANLVRQMEKLALLGMLVVVIVFFSLFPASRTLFASSANVSVVLANQAVILTVAAALLFPLIAGHFDFSVGATAVFASMVCAAAMTRFNAPVWIASLAALLAGLLIGLINGVVVARFGMNAFVSTLGMATLLGGLVQWYTGGLAIVGINQGMTQCGSSSWFGRPRAIYIVAVLVRAGWYILTQTPYGRALYALGSNGRSAALVGIPTQRYTIVAFLLSGVLASAGGIVLTARTGGANPDPGTYLLFPALTAAFLGTTGFLPGRFNIPGTVVGVLFVAAAVSGLTLSGAANWVDQVFDGAALLIAIGISSYLRRRREGATA
jgi:ribose transport system permease protein